MWQRPGRGGTTPSPVPDFTLADYRQQQYNLAGLMGAKGVLLGFIGDVWLPANVRRLQWLQRYTPTLQRAGVMVATLIPNETHTLYNFYISSPVPPQFPLLADADRRVHRAYQLDHRATLLLVDHQRQLHETWCVTEKQIWIDVSLLLRAAARL